MDRTRGPCRRRRRRGRARTRRSERAKSRRRGFRSAGKPGARARRSATRTARARVRGPGRSRALPERRGRGRSPRGGAFGSPSRRHRRPRDGGAKQAVRSGPPRRAVANFVPSALDFERARRGVAHRDRGHPFTLELLTTVHGGPRFRPATAAARSRRASDEPWSELLSASAPVDPEESARELAATKPRSVDRLRGIRGIGEVKARDLGPVFVVEIAAASSAP